MQAYLGCGCPSAVVILQTYSAFVVVVIPFSCFDFPVNKAQGADVPDQLDEFKDCDDRQTEPESHLSSNVRQQIHKLK